MIKYADNQDVYGIIKDIFEKIINSQVIPHLFNLSIIKPVIKNTKKNNSDIDNIRPIAVSEVLSNVYESTLLQMLQMDLNENPKQFGFKTSSSCSHAVFCVKQAVAAAKAMNKRLYVCAIDASKAFDKIIRPKLWLELIKNKISEHTNMALINYYQDSLMIISNNNNYSNIFRTKVGVRQGGVASPKLFSIYVNTLLENLTSSSEGFQIGQMKFDTLMYADDIIIINCTKKGLQNQLKIVENFGNYYDLKYNPEKSVYMVFNKNIKLNSKVNRYDDWQNEIMLNSKTINEVEDTRYLGFELEANGKNDKHIQKSKQKTVLSLIKLNKIGINNENTCPYLKSQMFKTYIRPVLFYGIENVYIQKTVVNKLKRIDGNIIKRLLNIPVRCKTSSLLCALNITPVEYMIKQAKLDFFLRIMENEYTKKIIENTLSLPTQNDLISEIMMIVDQLDEPLVQLQTKFTDKVKAAKYVIEV